MRRDVAGWLGFWAGFAALDLIADHRGASLCTATRHLFHTESAAGRMALTIAIGTGSMVLHRHLLKVSVVEPKM